MLAPRFAVTRSIIEALYGSIVEAHRRRCRARSAEHFLGHIDADNLACGSDLSRDDEAVETTPRPEIDNTLARLQSAERERVADAGKRLDRAVRHSGDDRVVIAQAVRQRASGMKWKLPCGLTATARYLVLTSSRSAIASTGKPSLISLLLRENCPIVVRGEIQRFGSARDRLVQRSAGFYPHLRPWSARLLENYRFITRTTMPIDDPELPFGFQDCRDGSPEWKTAGLPIIPWP